MKTSKELAELSIRITNIVHDSDTPWVDILHILVDEQLENVKSGMTDAANIAKNGYHKGHSDSYKMGCNDTETRILQARDAKKLIP